LVERVLREYAGEAFLSDAHYTRAQCLSTLQQFDEAFISYRLSFAARRAHPGTQNLAYLDFVWLVIETARADLHDEALRILDEFSGDGEIFPIHAYRNAAARALIWSEKGHKDRAAIFAREAIAASSQSESPFRYHRGLGLVDEIDQTLQARLFALSAAQPGVAPGGASPRR
jgi:hypothetical protein